MLGSFPDFNVFLHFLSTLQQKIRKEMKIMLKKRLDANKYTSPTFYLNKYLGKY